jgi:Leucine-rich repeat (LRR) protein
LKSTIIKYTLAIGFLLFLIACSVKKDRFINRNFHAVTTEYNVLYNGNIALDKGLENLNMLYSLNLVSNQIESIRELETLTFLVTLGLSHNKITSLSALNKLTKCESLFLFSNNIESLNGLENLSRLKTLNLGVNRSGEIPLPQDNTKTEKGHAVIAMGYDDNKVIGSCKGALQIRNSWGPDWGDKGYGWLPYDYVTKGHTAEWWVLLKADLVDDSKFGLQSKPLGMTIGSN